MEVISYSPPRSARIVGALWFTGVSTALVVVNTQVYLRGRATAYVDMAVIPWS